MQPVDPRIAAQRPTGCCSARLLGCGTRSPLYLIGAAASRRGLSRVGYFITLNGPLNGHPPSYYCYSDYLCLFCHQLIVVAEGEGNPPKKTIRTIFINLMDIDDNQPSFTDCPPVGLPQYVPTLLFRFYSGELLVPSS